MKRILTLALVLILALVRRSVRELSGHFEVKVSKERHSRETIPFLVSKFFKFRGAHRLSLYVYIRLQ